LHDHPSPLNALYRIRMILLGKNPGIVQAHANVQSLPGMEEEQYLVTKAFQQAKIGELPVKEPEVLEKEMFDVTSNTSFNSTASTVSMINVTEKDGLLYVAGYLAKKHQNEFPDLGITTENINTSLTVRSYNIPSWIQSLSYRGLTQPSQQWLDNVHKMEKRFRKRHEDNYKAGPNIIRKTTDYIVKKVYISR
jgi:hypothetical protein